jgi:septum formation protein
MRIILASQSPRRRELLHLTGLDFDVTPTNVDETQQDGEDPAHYAQRLSREKAQAAASQLEGEALIVAADTVVVYTGEVLGKPETTEEATTVLQRLRRKTHHVITAVTMLHTSGQMVSDTCSSSVIMRDYTDAAIAEYVTSGDPFDKAGAYGIQNDVFHPVEDFAHCFANVMGLPLCHISRMMGELGLDTPLDVPSSCQAGIGYNCPVFEAILRGEM